MDTAPSLDLFLKRAERVLAQLEAWLPPSPEAIDWQYHAYRWSRTQTHGRLQAIKHTASIKLSDLQHLDEQKEVLVRNTCQFLEQRPANNVLMTGARGTGKSSLVKAILHTYASQGLRLIEVDKDDLIDLEKIVTLVSDRPERFIIFCDDLSFETGETSYKALKSVLDGSLASCADNVLIYATSNRRHLMPEYMSDNLAAHPDDHGDIHPGESIEEKTSLSDRFGIWLPFYPFNQSNYLDIVSHWLTVLGCSTTSIETAKFEALQWATQRGSRSGRVAWQFAKDWSARHTSK